MSGKYLVVVSWMAVLQAACAVAQSVPPAETPLPTYATVRSDVTVKKSAALSTEAPRPAGFFQLAGAVDQRLCRGVVAALNEGGRYHGGDSTRWLLDSSHQIEFNSLDPKSAAGTQYVFPDLEYTHVDIDADGSEEHVYRLNSVLSSQWSQRLMIVPEELQAHPELLTSHAQRCTQVDPTAGCDTVATKIRYALTARVPDRLANEWQFTRVGILYWTTADVASNSLIFISRNQARRNVGSSSGAYWSLYKIESAVVAVAAPFEQFAPPELLVFSPSRARNGILQCVVMPVAWPE